MLKWLLGLLLAANLAFLAYMLWGGMATEEKYDASPPQPPLNAEKIKLLKIAPASAPVATPVPQSAAPASAIQQTAPPAQPQTACMQWGEFSGNDLARAAQALAALKLGSKLAQHQTEHNAGYWVYLPPQNSRADMARKIAELKALGITDYFVVQDSKQWLNAISLGIFKKEGAAREFLDNIRAIGVHGATLGERYSKLKFTVFDLKNLEPALAEKMTVLQKQFADSELKVVPCSN